MIRTNETMLVESCPDAIKFCIHYDNEKCWSKIKHCLTTVLLFPNLKQIKNTAVGPNTGQPTTNQQGVSLEGWYILYIVTKLLTNLRRDIV